MASLDPTFDEDAFDRGLGAPPAPTAQSKFDDAEFMKGLGPSSTRVSNATYRADDDAEFQRAWGASPAPQPRPGPQLSDDEEFQRAMGQSGVDWSKVGTDSPPSRSGVATDWSKIGTDSPAANPTGVDFRRELTRDFH